MVKRDDTNMQFSNGLARATGHSSRCPQYLQSQHFSGGGASPALAYDSRTIADEPTRGAREPSTPETPEEPEQPREGMPSIVDVWWTVNDQIVTSCQQDQTVIANVKVMANGGSVSGTLTVHVRKDIPY